MPLPAQLIGQTFGRLTVEEEIGRKHGKVLWRCRCECGGNAEATTGALMNGTVRSCGCLRREMAREWGKELGQLGRTHGMTGTPEHNAWANMRARCYNPNLPEYANYGGRGIKVCDRWLDSFEAFLEDIGPRPGPTFSVDRKDVNGDYEPGNCRWADLDTQNNNKRRNVFIEHEGRRMSVAQWARELGALYGIPAGAMAQRLHKCGSIEKAVSVPYRRTSRSKA